MDTKIENKLDAAQNAELAYQNQCSQQYEAKLVEEAYLRQDEARKTDPVAKPIVKFREWHAIKTSAAKLSDTLNIIERMGFPIAHIVSGGYGEYVVTGVRLVGHVIPEKDDGTVEPLPEVDPATEPKAPGEADESARREWENAE